MDRRSALAGAAAGIVYLLTSRLDAAAESLELVNFAPPFDPATIRSADIQVSQDAQGVRLAVGHANEWPGFSLKPAAKSWDLSAFGQLNITVRNDGPARAELCCRVDNPGADGKDNCNNGSIQLDPGQSDVLTVVFKPKTAHASDVKLSGMRGYPPGINVAGTLDTAAVTGLVIFVPKPQVDTAWRLGRVWADGRPPQVDALHGKPFLPFVDTYGQYLHRDWPGKIKDDADLRSRIAHEAADLAQHPAPADFDKWGGWKDGPQLAATGWFRVQKVDGKWWLVDPDGRLFWSHGVDCVGVRHDTITTGRDAWWQDYPGAQPEFAAYRGRDTFSFNYANLQRKYGPEWAKTWYPLCHARLHSWGFNTIGNWSHDLVKSLDRTPYTGTINTAGPVIVGPPGAPTKFRDVFDPSFAASLFAALTRQTQAIGDPWCLGFYVDNELPWGDDCSLALATLASPPEQAAKKVFVADVQARYGDIAKLNAAWQTSYADWPALLAARKAPNRDRARDDLSRFVAKLAEKYFETIATAVHAAAPHQLYLGCRFASLNAAAQRAAAKFCDVVSYNRYQRSVAEFHTATGDKPLIVGEFHFGALDRGMFHPGLVRTANQQERAAGYRSYVEGALRDPRWVGVHWFEYQDEPLTGRAQDGENYQIGMVDQQDTPYAETIAATRTVGAEVYRTRYDK